MTRYLKNRIFLCSTDIVFYTTLIQSLGAQLVEEKNWSKCLEIHSNLLIALNHRNEAIQKKEYLKKKLKES